MNYQTILMDRTRPLLQQMGVPGDTSTYVLGSFDQRITIYSQQVRALNLAFALQAHGGVDGKSIGVVGGGIAGLTFAAAALYFGARVTVFEKREEWIDLQRSSSRWVHPHIYDWPNEGATSEQADLPFLSWSAGPARDAVRMMLSDWNVHQNGAGDRFTEHRACSLM